MIFCPFCANLLLFEKSNILKYCCRTCPYVYEIKKEVVTYNYYEKKQVEAVFGGKDMWENVAKTDATCKKCEYDKAYFKEIQIRSADEPATIFFKCANIECGYEWREG